jgi:hypothetical protein
VSICPARANRAGKNTENCKRAKASFSILLEKEKKPRMEKKVKSMEIDRKRERGMIYRETNSFLIGGLAVLLVPPFTAGFPVREGPPVVILVPHSPLYRVSFSDEG